MLAIRIRDDVELPEFLLTDDRQLTVGSETFGSSEEYALAAIGFIWAVAEGRGWSEKRFRAVLRADPKLAPWADVDPLPDYEPAESVSPAEAEYLIGVGLAEPIEER